MAQVQSIQRCDQGQVTRFDLRVLGSALHAILRRLREARPSVPWHVRRHIPYHSRKHQQRRSKTSLPPKCTGLASWNIRGLKGKREELLWFLRQQRLAVLAVQETLCTPADWPLRVGPYTCIHSPAIPGSKGQQGVALLVHPDLPCYEVGPRSPYCVWAKVLGPGLAHGLVVGSVYLPGRVAGPPCTEARKALFNGLQTLSKANPQTPLIVMGDWNMSGPAVDKLLSQHPLPLARVSCRGSSFTRWDKTRAWSSLDHLVVSHSLCPSLSKARVHRSWDLSDHWPIGTRLLHLATPQTPSMGPRPTTTGFSTPAIHSQAPAIRLHNYWEVLESNEQPADLAVPRFVEQSVHIARQLRVCRPRPTPDGRQPPLSLPRECLALIQARRRAHREWRQAPLHGRDALWIRYEQLRLQAKERVRHARKEMWNQFIKKGASLLAEGQWAKAWQWIKSISQHHRFAAGRVHPVVNSQGVLQLDPVSILSAWAAHYATLGKDATGHSRDPAHWEPTGPPSPAWPELNVPITWPEVCRVLTSLKDQTAPGFDGLPPAWFKVMADPEPTATPTSPMGRVFFLILRSLWCTPSIPAPWNTAAVVSIHKAGDTTDPNNYRGISLISVALKVLCKVLTARLQTALEKRNALIPEQAGFRSKEECMGQAIALYETIARRRTTGQTTYAAFVDFKKAYDLVPHAALFTKLATLGVQGTALGFIKGLYQVSLVAVKTAAGHSEPFKLERGLRQGCPLSPILFDVFINDILDDCHDLGVTIPGVPNRKLAGLLFADDVVLLAPSSKNLRHLLRKISLWTARWEMSVGHGKCGVMVFGNTEHDKEHSVWTLDGAEIPLVDHYTYLGLTFDRDLSLDTMNDAATARLSKATHSLRPALTNSSIPLAVKVLMIKSLILPIAAWGGELLGMHKVRAHPTQKLVHQAIRWALYGDRAGKGRAAMSTLSWDLGIPPVHAIRSSYRTRAYHKFSSVKTWAAILSQHPFRHPRDTWLSGTRRWLTKEKVTATAAKPAKQAIWAKSLATDKTLSTARYRAAGFESTQRFVRLALPHPADAIGIRWLVRHRTHAVWNATSAVQAGLLQRQWKGRCPSCEMDEVDDGTHLLLRCPTFSSERALYIRPLVRKLARKCPGSSANEMCTLLLGGQYGEVPDHAQWWLGRTYTLLGEAPFLRVAKFLQSVMPRHMGHLWRLAQS